MERALLTFSRYDKKLMGVSYNSSIEISEKAMEGILSELEKQAENAKKNESNHDSEIQFFHEIEK